MHTTKFPYHYLLIIFLFFMLASCKQAPKPPEAEIVSSPEQIKESASDIIKKSLDYASENKGSIGDSTFLFNLSLIEKVYNEFDNSPIWSSGEQWKPLADSLFQLINHAKWYGLYPDDYYGTILHRIRQRIKEDSLGTKDRMDAALWSKADLLLTNAFFHFIRDIKLGRLPNDSISSRKDSLLTDDFYEQQLHIFQKTGSITKLIRPLEPKHPGYHLLKSKIPSFLDRAEYKVYTIVPPYRKDSLHFRELLKKRMEEGGYYVFDSSKSDSINLSLAVKKFQKEKGITVDGKAGDGTLRLLNMNDRERFARIALTMDKFKLLPDKMPARYIWVNIPSFQMRLQEGDSIRLSSKIIVGKPQTRTPVLNSFVSEIITYPQWTVPSSIIQKEILPAVKRDPGYLERKGFSLVDKDGEVVDPYLVEWAQYKKQIPYKVVQGSGDDNALGILKFNFPNKYAVYLHDTNQRHLFAQTMRSLSHGCVRVQNWEHLALYMIRNDDSTAAIKRFPAEDSMRVWLERKEKHSIPVRNKVSLFIRYFTVEPNEDGLVFYDDIYEEDKRLREKYLAGK